ncbi:MAG TPA: bifunctional oligoribonuclease/PAP phosphatase NrnA [Solirubrobacterales bacterium]|nr:bifunctional oligoribonuclease/PAP phosphatase NrnA [Solirubrobacterales bacterium]
MTPVATTGTEIDRAVEELRTGNRFLLTTHEGPDGDALGSLLAMQRILTQLDKDSVMFLPAKEFPLPVEYRFLPLTDVFHEPPVDVIDRVLVLLDCGNIDRMPAEFLRRDGARLINVDHHHDNTRFGDINVVDTDASCTAEIVLEIAKRLGAELTPEIASALYVALVTDTGRFSYENTDAAAHRMAAELIEAGVDVDDTHRRLYERVPIEKLRLVARALDRVEQLENGRLAVTYVSRDDYELAGADEVLVEGIIDYVRSLQGTLLAAVIRDRGESGGTARKVSLRSTDGSIDVSAIARKHGGGGHRRAAGFGTDLGYDELLELLRAEVADAI